VSHSSAFENRKQLGSDWPQIKLALRKRAARRSKRSPALEEVDAILFDETVLNEFVLCD
jgi:hypothetical protein